MLNSINDETRLALLCENFAYLNSEERAGVIFTTSDDVKIFGVKIFALFIFANVAGSGGLHYDSRLWREKFQESFDIKIVGGKRFKKQKAFNLIQLTC